MKEGDRFRLRPNSVLYKLFGDKTYTAEQIDIFPANDGTDNMEKRILFYIGNTMYFELEKYIDVISYNEHHNIDEIRKISVEFKDGRIREYNKPMIDTIDANNFVIKDRIYEKYRILINTKNHF